MTIGKTIALTRQTFVGKVMSLLLNVLSRLDITLLPRRSEERRVGKEWKQCQILFLGSSKSLQMVTAAMKLKDAYSLEGKLCPT